MRLLGGGAHPIESYFYFTAGLLFFGSATAVLLFSAIGKWKRRPMCEVHRPFGTLALYTLIATSLVALSAYVWEAVVFSFGESV